MSSHVVLAARKARKSNQVVTSTYAPECYKVVVPDDFAVFGLAGEVTFTAVECGADFYTHNVFMDRESMLGLLDVIIEKVRNGGDSGPFAFFIEIDTGDNKNVKFDVNYDEVNFTNKRTNENTSFETHEVDDDAIRDTIENEPAFFESGTTFLLQIAFNQQYHSFQDGETYAVTYFSLPKEGGVVSGSSGATVPEPPAFQPPAPEALVLRTPPLCAVVPPASVPPAQPCSAIFKVTLVPGFEVGDSKLCLVHNTMERLNEPVVGILKASDNYKTFTAICAMYPDRREPISDAAREVLSRYGNVTIIPEQYIQEYVDIYEHLGKKFVLPQALVCSIIGREVRDRVAALFDEPEAILTGDLEALDIAN